MHIELTDHLRCPADHDEAYLVLLPDAVAGRSVRSGQLGCPICHRTFEVREGVVDLGDAPVTGDAWEPLDGASLAALTGLSGPGGYLAVVGPAASEWAGLAGALPGIHMVLVNPPMGLVTTGASIIRSGVMPLKQRSMRGVVLSGTAAGDARWIEAASRVVLPGLRVLGQGTPPVLDALELLASADGWWVAARTAR